MVKDPRPKDLRTSEGRAWKKRHAQAAPKKRRADGTLAIARPPTEELLRFLHKTEHNIRSMATQIRPAMADNIASDVRTELLRDADRMYKRLRALESK